jgi:hypothetical protein
MDVALKFHDRYRLNNKVHGFPPSRELRCPGNDGVLRMTMLLLFLVMPRRRESMDVALDDVRAHGS